MYCSRKKNKTSVTIIESTRFHLALFNTNVSVHKFADLLI